MASNLATPGVFIEEKSNEDDTEELKSEEISEKKEK